MGTYKTVYLRFREDSETDMQAYKILQELVDNKKFNNYTNAVVNALISFNNSGSLCGDVALPVQHHSAENIADTSYINITDTVLNGVKELLPELVASTLMQLMGMGCGTVPSPFVENKEQEEKQKETNDDYTLSDEAWGFLSNF